MATDQSIWRAKSCNITNGLFDYLLFFTDGIRVELGDIHENAIVFVKGDQNVSSMELGDPNITAWASHSRQQTTKGGKKTRQLGTRLDWKTLHRLIQGHGNGEHNGGESHSTGL